MCWGNRHAWTWGTSTASDAVPLSLRCACGRYSRQEADDVQAALVAAEQRAERAEAALKIAEDALEYIAGHRVRGPAPYPVTVAHDALIQISVLEPDHAAR